LVKEKNWESPIGRIRRRGIRKRDVLTESYRLGIGVYRNLQNRGQLPGFTVKGNDQKAR